MEWSLSINNQSIQAKYSDTSKSSGKGVFCYGYCYLVSYANIFQRKKNKKIFSKEKLIYILAIINSFSKAL